jgi:hypothetical protein
MNEKVQTRELEKEGWTKRFIACEPKLSEAVTVYREAGLEVHLEPMATLEETGSCNWKDPLSEECRICFKGFEDEYKIIFTRFRKGD